MANPTVDKLKTLGLHHGEKFVVALTAGICLFCLFKAITRETIDKTPDEVKKSASDAMRNINKRHDPEELSKKLEDEFLTVPDLVKKVDAIGKDEKTKALLAFDPKPWVTAPPDAGLQRIAFAVGAPYDLVATASRGGPLMYKLDKDGNRVKEKIKDDEPKPEATPKSRRGRNRRPGGPLASGPAMMTTPEDARASVDPKNEARQREKTKAGIVGAAGIEEDDKEPEAEDDMKDVEIVRGLRWVAVTGLFDHRKLRESYAKALNLDFASAHPNYQRVDLQRQTLASDGVTWPDKWEKVDRDANREVLNNLPEREDELTLEEVRLPALVDILPFLKTGTYRGVHLASFLTADSKSALSKPKPAPAATGSMSPYSMKPPMMDNRGRADDSSMARSMLMPSMGMEMGRSTGAEVGEDTNFPKSEALKLMVRVLDFTVDPEVTYRYRACVVVKNPNYGREDVAPGTDTTTKEVSGAWSEATDLVTIPADVSTYAVEKTLAGNLARGDEVRFQVATWNAKDGQTIVKAFDAGPGKVIGEPSLAKVPDPDGKKAPSTKIDFTSRQVVLDTEGGTRPVSQLDLPGAGFNVPAMAVVLRPDGTIAVRSEARDKRDPTMSEMLTDYTQAVKDAEGGVVKHNRSNSRSSGGSASRR